MTPSSPGAWVAVFAVRSVTTSTVPLGLNDTCAQPEGSVPAMLRIRVDPGIGVSAPLPSMTKPVTDGMPSSQLGGTRPSIVSPLFSTYTSPRLTVTLTGFSPLEF